ncbi:hypothetical protein ELUMI_v1c07970 [Williamsoniiplasma luminosum]|uniref:Lipoprotein n=2 Tax=Williamsoniiplasma luminosum TaxID=214888 RepID=A0A2K8NUN6_9MOLU|nr:lipoprotein [Williamsoniiplasma luminosum]ATZ17519.1 hypothetical protein ELUMI_v1c07970 [Williamsoniiplasma luminosum]
MKKLLTLLGSVGMVAATAATVVACNPGKNDAKVSDSTIKVGKHGEINLTRDEIKEVEGYNDVKAYEEGFVPAPATKADAEKPKPVLDKVKLENGVISFTGLKEGKATIVLQGTKKAPVTPGTKTDAAAPKLELLKTKFTVIVEPSRQPVKSIKEVIKTLALGEIADVKPETILATINKVNAGANLLATDIKIEVGTDNKSAKIIGQGIFNGDVTVTFTVKTPTEDKRTDIGTLVKTLGKLEVDTTKDAVIDAFIAKNPNAKLVKDELQIKDELAADATTAKIEVKSTSTTHKGFVDVNFEKKPVEGSKTDIGTLVKVLGKLEVDTTKDAVIEAFIAKNPNAKLVKAELQIKDELAADATTAKIEVKSSTTHTGVADVTFEKKPVEGSKTDIGTLVKTLGKLEVDTTKDAVIDAFIAKNPNAKLVKDELQIKDELAADATTAKIEVKSSTTHTGFADVTFEKKA